MRRAAAWLAAALLFAGCGGGPVLANPPAQRPVATPDVTPSPSRPADPQPIVLPRDDAPHDRLTEWWYYTGHLQASDGRRFGFEYVIFRAERGTFPVAWASHVALTDERRGQFVYAQRSEIGAQVDRRAADGITEGFDFALSPRGPSPVETWTMAGADGRDRVAAAFGPREASDRRATVAFTLDLRSTKPAALHDRDGWIDFASAGSSYYYSRTRMSAVGRLSVDGETFEVDGQAWFDHQWGDFIAVGGGGWDWFAINLEDGTDLTLSLVRDRDGSYPLVYGTLVDPSGQTRHLERGAFTVTVTDHWTSSETGIRYPSGWKVSIPSLDLVVRLRPTVPDQELDTRATSGVAYWEGSQDVAAAIGSRSLDGDAYVELTGYGRPSTP